MQNIFIVPAIQHCCRAKSLCLNRFFSEIVDFCLDISRKYQHHLALQWRMNFKLQHIINSRCHLTLKTSFSDWKLSTLSKIFGPSLLTLGLQTNQPCTGVNSCLSNCLLTVGVISSSISFESRHIQKNFKTYLN